MYNETNETLNLLYERGSVRAFTDKPVSNEVLKQILLTAKHAASGGNLQPVSIIVITDKAKKEELAKLPYFKFATKVPVLMLFCLDLYRTKRWAELEHMAYTAHKSFRHFWIAFQDVMCHMQSVCTAADSVGLGSCIYGTVLECFYELKELFNLPNQVMPINLVSFGYPKQKPSIKHKLELDMLCHMNEYEYKSDKDFLNKIYQKFDKDLELKQEYLSEIHRVCNNVEGKQFADEAVSYLKQRGSIPQVCRYYGYKKYNADIMANHNLHYTQVLKNFGFDILEKHDFSGKSAPNS
ncbi:nitroreductase family protein [Clostridium sp. 'deep sea']|uniref:nitroreductase family protein n=1 Tax=Clostridium sp. 'deep sea' TaxID=2779445 RepID=UPI0018967AA6|nr:nitroreductase family protein [Clostridium sp. 'deep sea']QOR36264.1 nitroreductase family protein [Clostridium sp. 'deep sea']